MKCKDCKYNAPNFFVCTYDKTKITLADVEFNKNGEIVGCNKGYDETSN